MKPEPKLTLSSFRICPGHRLTAYLHEKGVEYRLEEGEGGNPDAKIVSSRAIAREDAAILLSMHRVG